MSYVGSASLPGSLESIIYIMKLENPLRQMVICVTFYLYFLYGHQTFSNYDICEDFVVSCILPVNTGACRRGFTHYICQTRLPDGSRA